MEEIRQTSDVTLEGRIEDLKTRVEAMTAGIQQIVARIEALEADIEELRKNYEALKRSEETKQPNGEVLSSSNEALSPGKEAIKGSDEVIKSGNEAQKGSGEAIRHSHEALKSSDGAERIGKEALNSDQEALNIRDGATRSGYEAVNTSDEARKMIEEASKFENRSPSQLKGFEQLRKNEEFAKFVRAKASEVKKIRVKGKVITERLVQVFLAIAENDGVHVFEMRKTLSIPRSTMDHTLLILRKMNWAYLRGGQKFGAYTLTEEGKSVIEKYGVVEEENDMSVPSVTAIRQEKETVC